jgi:hypothetical protein
MKGFQASVAGIGNGRWLVPLRDAQPKRALISRAKTTRATDSWPVSAAISERWQRSILVSPAPVDG